jgi:hypothetical protein
MRIFWRSLFGHIALPVCPEDKKYNRKENI